MCLIVVMIQLIYVLAKLKEPNRFFGFVLIFEIVTVPSDISKLIFFPSKMRQKSKVLSKVLRVLIKEKSHEGSLNGFKFPYFSLGNWFNKGSGTTEKRNPLMEHFYIISLLKCI